MFVDNQVTPVRLERPDSTDLLDSLEVAEEKDKLDSLDRQVCK